MIIFYGLTPDVFQGHPLQAHGVLLSDINWCVNNCRQYLYVLTVV